MKPKLRKLVQDLNILLRNNNNGTLDKEKKVLKIAEEIKASLQINDESPIDIKEDLQLLRDSIKKLESKMVKDQQIFDDFLNFLEQKK
ncbi:MAG: hypothetical protein CMP33_05360 [Rickettsiales bacterium]|nr:hypothetical protein [Rickettsiales bacterium]|tara:strand:+ start:399 stop:662 length:264 start_codon:yes stop_codon:yes gene_type:complete